jgi:hypothetical protein
MKRRLSWRQHAALLLVGATSAGLLSAAVTASAHRSKGYYAARWGAGALEGGLPWRFAADFPSGGGIRERVRNAASRWNAQGQALRFDYRRGTADVAFPPSSCPPLDRPETNAVHWGPVGGSAIGVANLCTFGEAGGRSEGTYHSFQIKLDSTVSWYTGKAAPGRRDVDIQGPATHEFGHATGRESGGAGVGHFDDSWSVCRATRQDHHTMCERVFTNVWWDRTLNSHDKHVFDRKY